MKIKVILVDDHQLILNGLAKTLNDDPDIKVISTIAGSQMSPVRNR